MRLVKCLPGHNTFGLVGARDTWTKKEQYQLDKVIAVHRIENPRLTTSHETHLQSLGGGSRGNETQVSHGCADTAMSLDNADSIIQTGFLKKYWKTSAGNWQRVGPGF